MKKSLLLLVFTVILSATTIAQDEKSFGIKFSGFVKTDIYWDSRQTISVREGQFLLYPANENLDPDGNDINAKSSFNMVSIQTRLRGTITGPDALGAKTSGVIEGAFFGNINSDINGFRLRLAYIQLDWKKTQLLVGQYWHPAFVTYCFPGTISFNTGVPFVPFTRNPQIRVTQKLGKFNLIATALSQVDFLSDGPIGPNARYLRNTAVPALNLRFEYRNINTTDDKEFLIGASVNYKMLLPRLQTDSGYKTSNTVGSISETFYLKLKYPKVTFKLQGVYAQDAYNWTMIGGYAVESITDPMKDFRDYTPITTASAWLDVHSNGKKWQVGVLTGYAQNLGASEDIIGPNYQRGRDIAYVYRIAPRFVYNSGRFRIAPEVEYTVAAYATEDANGVLNIDSKGVVTDSKEIGNLRFLLGVYLFF
jgi:hypothetical protein